MPAQVSRSEDAAMPKRMSYISDSVCDLLAADRGHQLRITGVGVKARALGDSWSRCWS